MNKTKLSVIALSLITSFSASAAFTDELSSAVKESKIDLSLRYRVEFVDQDSKDEDALASTLKSRLSITSGNVRNFSAKVEADNVSYIGNDNFNSTTNGNASHPVVADPDGTEINQAFLKYTDELFSVTAGRQRINLDDQRFVGGVAWRQNEQTYDGYRLNATPIHNLSVDVSYVYNVNRIFGEDSNNSDFHGDVILTNGKYTLGKNHSVSAFYYSMEFDNAASASNNTLGLTYNGKVNVSGTGLTLKAGYATQEDAGDNANNYDADYMVFDVMADLGKFTVGAGYELLGSDNGVGFQTPLATAHKFQGFSDQFLSTPGNGVEDMYVKGSTSVSGFKLSAAYHVFSADEGGADYGDEINLTAAYKVNKQISTLIKAASYNADDFGSDTNKIWFMVSANF